MALTRILMVCLGNICRSPLAEGILQAKINSNFVIVDSAGTAGYHEGNSADRRSIAVARDNGIDLSHQQSRKFKVNDFDNFDVIYAMDNSNYEHILKLARSISDTKKVKLILNELYPNKNLDVPDPYYGIDNGFVEVFNMLDKACTIIAKKYNKNE